MALEIRHHRTRVFNAVQAALRYVANMANHATQFARDVAVILTLSVAAFGKCHTAAFAVACCRIPKEILARRL